MKYLAFFMKPFKLIFAQYLHNLRAWYKGWGRFRELVWKPGWNWTQLRWKLAYATTYLIPPLFFAGPVVSMSWWMHLHRDGFVWDKILDIIDTQDPKHGEKAGSPLWETTECAFPIRVAVPIIWVYIFNYLFGLLT